MQYVGQTCRKLKNRFGEHYRKIKKPKNSVSCFGVRFSVMFHFMFVHYTFSSVWVAEWPPFGK